MSENEATTDVVLRALLAVTVAMREERAERRVEASPTEVLLANAGLTPRQIATVTGREYEAVRSVLKRHKGAANKTTRRPKSEETS